MTLPNDARQTVYSTFKTGWEAAYPAVPYVFDNETKDTKGLDEWVRVIVRHTSGGQDSLGAVGNRRYERRGLVLIQLYAAVNRGLLRLDELANTALGLFEGKTIDQVFFYDARPQEAPKEGQWARLNVIVEFTYDEIK
jgi:hypothetical protein